jgi:hypothetical protein
MRQANESEKYFIYKTRQLMTDTNKAKLEGVIKAFGLIHDVDTTLTESDTAKFESIETLEQMRGDTDPKVFLESITMDAMKAAGTANFQNVRRSLNYYRNWLDAKSV